MSLDTAATPDRFFSRSSEAPGFSRSQHSGREVAIIGMSGRFPGGANSPEELWELLRSGRDGVGEVKGDRWDLGWHHPDSGREERVYTRAGGFLERIDTFDAEFFGISPKEARQVDPQHRLMLELAWEAMEDANLAPRQQAGKEIGVFLGISGNEYAHLVGPQGPDAYSNTGSAISIAANRISYIFDLHGPSVALDTACSSSLVCVHQACVSLLAGECSAALAGGVNLLVHVRPWIGFSKASMLSPTGRCKSFDASGDGYVRSEGGGLVLLKRLEEAERDGDRILGVILASGVNSDGRTLGLSMPNGDAQENLLRKVYGLCGVKADDVFYVEAHGTGTSVGDPIECGALGRVLGAPREDGSVCYLGSVKSNIGHLEAASGIAGLTKVLLSLRHREIPGNLHFVTPNPKIDFEGSRLSVVTKPTPIPFRKDPIVIGVNSFGFGGTNAHLVVQEYRAPHTLESNRGGVAEAGPHLLLLSGHSQDALTAVARSYVEFLDVPQEASWADICATAVTCRSLQRYRLAVQADTATEAAAQLRCYLEGKPAKRLATGSALAPLSPLVFVFSGNGPQWWGMGRELLQENQLFRHELEAIDTIFAPLAGWSLLEEMQLPQEQSRVVLTEYAQPLLFALQLGLLRVLREAGVVPSAVLGHSVGEVAAAFAAGALTLEDATRVIYYRSKAQARTAGSGRMAALGIGVADAMETAQEVGGWIEIAAENAPEAVTVAGDPEALERIVAVLTQRGKFARILQLNYPFHTKAMETLREELSVGLQDLNPRKTEVPFISTVEGDEVEGSQLDAEYWYRNVRERVEFDEAIETLLERDHTSVFLEIGPHPVLKDYVQQIAKANGFQVASLQTLRRPGPKGAEPETDNLWTAISACYANGAVDTGKVFRKPVLAPDLPVYPWQRTVHWRGDVILPDIHHPTHRDHPLLGYPLTTGEGIWENTIDINTISYLRDHVVQRSVLFPAAGYIEIAFSAAQRLLGHGGLVIEDMDILRPLAIAEHQDPLLQFSMDSATGLFEIRSRSERYSKDWTKHVRGRVSRSESSSGQIALDLKSLSSKFNRELSAEQHYLETAARGMEYGPAFRGVQKLLAEHEGNSREVLAFIHLPPEAAQDFSSYRTHPSLLDSCLQVIVMAIALKDASGSAIIPVRFDYVRSYAALPESMVCHVVIRQESERSAVADFRVMDVHGNLLMHLEGARCQKTDFVAGNPVPLISEWWKLDPSASPATQIPVLPSPSEIGQALGEKIQKISNEHDRPLYYEKVKPRLDLLAKGYIAKAIDALWRGQERFNIDALLPDRSRESAADLERLIGLAREYGIVIPDGPFVKRTGESLPEPKDLWRDLFLSYPACQGELMQLMQAGELLLDSATGKEVSGSISAASESLFDAAPFQSVYNTVARAVVEELVHNWPPHRPIRVLELGGDGASLASWLLPILPQLRTDYLFTSPSEIVVGRAEHRFSDYQAARFMVLDWASDLSSQGLPDSFFDLVVAGNAVHAVDDSTAWLTQLQRVMAPGGHMLLIEAHRSAATDLMFFHSPAWWGAQRGGKQFSSRLRDQETWLERFSRAGLKDSLVLSDIRDHSGILPQQTVFLAQRGHEASSSVVFDQGAQEAAPKSLLLILEGVAGPVEENLQNGLIAHLQTAGCEVLTHRIGSRSFAETWGTIGGADSVVYLAAASSPAEDSKHLLEGENARCLALLEIVRTLEETRLERAARLTLVTRGTFANAFGEGPIDPAQAPLWGLGRVIANEHPGLDCRLVDLHASAATAANASALLAREMLGSDDETEVQLCAGFRFVNREHIVSMTDEARRSRSRKKSSTPGYMLDISLHGGLDSLHLHSLERTEPAAGKVEIAVHAAGLNFRDVLWTMGVLPEEALEEGFSGPTIGMECAGEVVRVGPDVRGVNIGDRVVAFASSCFASHVTTDAGSIHTIPAGMSFHEAATIPTAFLTAFYALDELARLKPGESILIHGAAGGVGIAAIQVAKWKGAKVFGTAGSARKRRMLEMLGVDHVLNSRSLDFADEVMSLTDGAGVDVVLNSLAGDAILRSLKCLKPFGRFLEIGKRDLYANTHMGLRPFRKNLSYFAIDADTLLVERRDLARSLFERVMELFERGTFRPLPFEIIPISRASEAFRAMQQSRHIGKLVISTELDETASLPVVETRTAVKPNATYLVTGGLGGFGLATAKWLAEEGATSLALLSRRGATTEEAKDGIDELKKQGVQVSAFAVDIADRESLTSVVATIRETMPSIAGVVHSAAVIEDAPIMQISPDLLNRVLSPKIAGAWNLHLATLNDPVEMFVMYSSSSTVVGNPGQGAYVAANLYLDSLAQYRRSLGLPGLAVGWGAIKDVGFLTRHGNVAEMLRTRTGMDAMPSEEALHELGRLAANGVTRMCVAQFDLQRLGRILPGTLVPRFMSIITPAAAAMLSAEESLVSMLQRTSASERRRIVVESVREQAAKVLGSGSAQIDPDQSLAELGLDSLMAVELAVAIERNIEKPISVMQLLSAGNIHAISDLVLNVLGVEKANREAASEKEPSLAESGR